MKWFFRNSWGKQLCFATPFFEEIKYKERTHYTIRIDSLPLVVSLPIDLNKISKLTTHICFTFPLPNQLRTVPENIIEKFEILFNNKKEYLMCGCENNLAK